MWTHPDGIHSFPADVGALIREAERSAFFDPSRPLLLARAPGRLDLMGGIADYSGSLVLQMPLASATIAAVQSDPDPVLKAFSTTVKSIGGSERVELPLEHLTRNGKAISNEEARLLLTRQKETRWIAYVAGALLLLQRAKKQRLAQGLRIMIGSTVPAGKGLSSSAALEVSVMKAMAALYGIELPPARLASLCQSLENHIVGAPCGIMDQMTSACGEEGKLLKLLCQPDTLLGNLSLPAGIEVWGIDSDIRHEVSGTEYADVRTGAFMGYRMIAGHDGSPVRLSADGRVEIDDRLRRGYLANVTPREWETRYGQIIPESIGGDDFLKRFSGISDRATRVEPGKTYGVRNPTAHPIYEHHRVSEFARILESPSLDEESRLRLGELMHRSHFSYSRCGLGSEGTDLIVELARKAGPGKGIFGAKITGGGSGGTVAILAASGSTRTIEKIAGAYEAQTGRNASITGGSSPGAERFGILSLTPR